MASRTEGKDGSRGLGRLHGREPNLAGMARDPALRAELLAMCDAQRRDPAAAHACADRLWEIFDDYEAWPGRTLVGADGSEAAWRLAQEAIDDVGLQRRAEELLDLAIEAGDADPVHHAYLVDRLRMADGQDQLYGSQFVIGAAGELEPWPLDDPAAVDERRRRLGLPPLAEHARVMRERWRERRDRV